MTLNALGLAVAGSRAASRTDSLLAVGEGELAVPESAREAA